MQGYSVWVEDALRKRSPHEQGEAPLPPLPENFTGTLRFAHASDNNYYAVKFHNGIATEVHIFDD